MTELEWDDAYEDVEIGEWDKDYDEIIDEEQNTWKSQTKLPFKKRPMKKEELITENVITCPACFQLKERGKKCPHCGYKPVYYMGIEVYSNEPIPKKPRLKTYKP